jgi:hypothetical protein
VDASSNMYANAKTWNPFKGCRFDCTYCEPTFKLQAKRQGRTKSTRPGGCFDCYRYVPHYHEDRLDKIPGTKEIVFVCGNADISFCSPEFTRKIIASVRADLLKSRKKKTYYFQSKKPAYFRPFLKEFPPEVILVTTLETNRDEGYRHISKAPLPSVRYRQFRSLAYPRKVLTIEPVIDFDPNTFFRWIVDLLPEYVWLGFNSKPESIALPEPSEKKVQDLVNRLMDAGIEVRGKTLRGVDLRKVR